MASLFGVVSTVIEQLQVAHRRHQWPEDWRGGERASLFTGREINDSKFYPRPGKLCQSIFCLQKENLKLKTGLEQSFKEVKPPRTQQLAGTKNTIILFFFQQIFAWPFRGTQRICSSHYLFPKGILLAGKNTGVSMSWLGNFVIDKKVLPGNYWLFLAFQPELALETLKPEDDQKK